MSLADTWLDQVARYYGVLPATIVNYKTVSIESLLQQKASFSSAVKTVRKSPDAYLRNVAALPERCCVVIGWVQSAAGTGAAVAALGALCLEEQGAAVSVQFSGAGHAPYGRQVVCLTWNLIVDKPGKIHIEVDDWLILNQKEALDDVEAVEVNTAKVLLINRKQLRVDTVSIYGCVEAVSELVRIKGDPLFLVKLKEEGGNVKVNILIKGSKFLFWNSLLCPNQELVFTHLKPTSIYKGTSQEECVFSPWNASELLASTHCHVKIHSLQDWLIANNVAGVEASQLCPGTDMEKKSESNSKLYTVKAVITDTKEAHRGIYEIDGKARLCLSYVPSCHEYRHLRSGTLVTIHNAHLRGHPQPPKTRLCCCMLGCVKVDQFSRLDTKVQPYVSSQCVESHLLTRYRLSWHGWERLIETLDAFQLKLGSDCPGPQASSLLYSLLTSSACSNAERLLKENARNLVLEFLQHDGRGRCSVEAGENMPTGAFPSMAALQEQLGLEVERLTADDRAVPAGASVNFPEQNFWRYRVVPESDEKKLLYIGWLTVSRHTGQLQLRDDSDAIDCVLAAPSGDNLHTCGEKCRLQLKSWGQGANVPSCPMMSVDCVGKLVCVQRATYVVEVFAMNGIAGEPRRQQQQGVDTAYSRKYLLCSLEDIVYLDDLMLKKTVGKKSKSFLLPHKCLSDKNVSEKSSASHCKRRKLHSNVSGASGSTDISHWAIPGEPPVSDPVTSPCSRCAAQLLMVLHKDGLSIRSRVNQPWLSSYIQVCLLGQPVLTSHEECLLLATPFCTSGKKVTLVDKAVNENSRLAVLSLQQDAIRWFPLLHIGGIYILTQHCCDSLGAFQRTTVQRQLSRVLEEAHTKQIITMRKKMDLRPVCVEGQSSVTQMVALKRSLMDENHVSDLLSVDEVLALRTSALVSFHGIVTAKHFEEAQPLHQNPQILKQQQDQNVSLGVSVPGDCSLRLTVRSTSSPEAISVYITTSNLSYLLGLLPGAHVAVHRAQLKLSRVGRVYASCGLACCITVANLPAPGLLSENVWSDGPRSSKSAEQDMINTPQQYLCSPPEGCTTFVVSCHVQTVRKLELQATCARCAAAVYRNVCGSMACGSTQAPVCKGTARVMVDDGSSNALVYIDCNQLQSLLTLTDIQWADLELAIAQHGAVTYNQGTSQDCFCPLCQLLKSLCESPLVQREVIMAVRRSRSASTNNTGWALRSVDLGGTEVETYYPPLLILQCVALKTLDCRQKINQLLQEDSS